MNLTNTGMSAITLRIDKGSSSQYRRIVDLASCFQNVRECRRHFVIYVSEEETFLCRKELSELIELVSRLPEGEMFDIPEYGTDEWANWMIDLHCGKR